MRIPTDLLKHAVDILVFPSHPLQYGRERDAQAALLELCLVSRDLYRISAPHLYSTIIISSALQLTKLFNALSTLANHHVQHTRSLSLRDFPHALLPPSSTDLASLLVLVRPFLRRLLFDRQLRIFWPEEDKHGVRPLLRGTLAPCHQLEEAVSIQCEFFLGTPLDDLDYWVCWPGWTSLRRFAIYNPGIDVHFVEAIIALPHLTHLVLDTPDFEATEPGLPIIQKLFKRGKSLRRVIFISGRELQRAFYDLETLQEMRVAARTAREGLDVAFLRAPVLDDKHMMENRMMWIRSEVEKGTLWELEGVSLSGTS